MPPDRPWIYENGGFIDAVVQADTFEVRIDKEGIKNETNNAELRC
jgi:hypothetical protein